MIGAAFQPVQRTSAGPPNAAAAPGTFNAAPGLAVVGSHRRALHIVATKIDKLARGQRIRAMRELESVFEHPVLPVSAVTGEGLDELWTLIDKLTNDNSSRRKPPHNNNPNRLPRATAGPPARQPHWGPRAAAPHRRR